MISFISSVEIKNVDKPDSKTFFWIVVSFADADAINPYSVKSILANGFSTIFIKYKPVFNNGPNSLPKNPPDCPILCNLVFHNFLLAEELFAKV